MSSLTLNLLEIRSSFNCLAIHSNRNFDQCFCMPPYLLVPSLQVYIQQDGSVPRTSEGHSSILVDWKWDYNNTFLKTLGGVYCILLILFLYVIFVGKWTGINMYNFSVHHKEFPPGPILCFIALNLPLCKQYMAFKSVYPVSAVYPFLPWFVWQHNFNGMWARSKGMISLHTLTHISSDCSSWALEIRIQFVSRSALVCMCECAIGGGGGGVVGGLHVWMCLCSWKYHLEH